MRKKNTRQLEVVHAESAAGKHGLSTRDKTPDPVRREIGLVTLSGIVSYKFSTKCSQVNDLCLGYQTPIQVGDKYHGHYNSS